MHLNLHPNALPLLAACLALGGQVTASGAQQAPHPCGELRNAYGPYDYRKDRDKLEIVETFHFTPMVESLIKPQGRHFGGDFDYTLRASPNHHRALIAMARFAERIKQESLPDARYTVDCWFDRAIRFAPDDMVVRMIYAGHLGRSNRVAKANEQLDFVVRMAGDNPLTQYNAGLTYLEFKQYEQALVQAHISMRMGITRTELRDALVAAGRWKEPAATAAPPIASAPDQ
jgi:hypothetical protein